MEQLLNEIELALKFGLYQVALQSCLALPDICATLESSDGTPVGTRYKKWYDANAKGKVSSRLSSEDCYLLRCAMIHRAITIPEPRKTQSADYSKIIFTIPNTLASIHDCIFEFESDCKVLELQLDTFCREMIKAVRKWQQKMKEERNDNYERNYQFLIKYHPDGLPPYVVGIPILSSGNEHNGYSNKGCS